MTDHKIGTREEWLAGWLEPLKAEKERTRRSDELAQWRQRLPWVRIDKKYLFETDDGTMLEPIYSEDARSFSFITSCLVDYTGGCPHALPSWTASRISP